MRTLSPTFREALWLFVVEGLSIREIAEILLDAGADPAREDPEGSSALTLAQGSGDAALVAMLEEAAARRVSRPR